MRYTEGLTHGHNSREGRQPLPTGIAGAPSVILWSVQQVDVATRVYSNWRQSSCLCITIHRLNVQDVVFDSIVTFIGIPGRLPCTVSMAIDT